MHKLLVTIVKKGMAKKIVKASKEAGAEGGTIIMGKGTGIHDLKSFFGITIEPEKEVILTLIHKDKLNQVMEAVIAAGSLDKPGYGIAFVIDVKKVAGIVHLLRQKV
jgi:nitrogen regulatory protein PII